MNDEQQNIRQANQSSDLYQNSQANQSDLKNQIKYTLKALLYKSFKIQKRNYCSNICQILTPLLCLAFTLLAQLISGELISGKIQNFDFPQPLDFPYYYLLADSLNLSCSQSYLYQLPRDEQTTINVDKIFNHTLKYYCSESDSLMPKYVSTNSVNQYLMKQIKTADKQAFERGNDLKTNLPDALIKFKSINTTNLNVTFGVNDLRLPEYHKNNGITKIKVKTKQNQQISSYLRVTEGMMNVMQKVNRAFLQLSSPKEIIMGSFMYMPFDGEQKSFKNKIINIVGAGLYPLGLSLLLPLFLYSVVTQKQERLIQIMKMNGLNVKYYWVNNFIFNFIITIVMLTIFYCFAKYYLALTMFVETSPTVLWTLFIGWAIALISLTNFVQIFINSAKSSTIIGYLLSIFSCFVGQAITTLIYSYPQKVPTSILLYPPFALCRAIYLIGYNCASNSSCYKDLNQTDSQFLTIVVVLYGWFLIYLCSVWLNEIIQQEYGVSHYPQWVVRCIKCLKCCKHQQHQQLSNQDYDDFTIQNVEFQLSESTQLIISDSLNPSIDHSINKLKQQVDKLSPSQKPMVIKLLSKKYLTQSSQSKNYIALKPLSLFIENKQIFGLLGPNGAGKTTLISVLTGMYPQTTGIAWINGLEIGSSTINKSIGVCPQFDLLWSSLTVYEHLKFYSTLKIVRSQFIEEQINSLLKDVDLQDWKNSPSNQLSGGMKRRLSLAISLVGNPKIVFLDEPSSGLDPSHRRDLWNILLSNYSLIKEIKKRTSILLTTHLMQQAEVLCDRVGILNKGQLRCIGSIDELKQRFGKGYRLTISFSRLLKKYFKPKFQPQKQLELETQNQISLKNQTNANRTLNSHSNQGNLNPQIINKIIQKFDAQIMNELNTRIILKIDKAFILECIQMLKNENSINWLVSQPSLYDVFIHFVN